MCKNINIEIITFDDTEIERHNFHHHKNPMMRINVDSNEIFRSNKVFFL